MGMSEDLTGKREAEGNEDSGKVYGMEPGRKKNEQEMVKILRTTSGYLCQ